MPSVPRIVVVDPTYTIARILRGAMVLMNRPYILVEVPTAEDALEEILRTKTALVLTTYRLESASGVELATHLSHESLGTPVIILAETGDPIPDKKSLEQAPFQYFVRPVAEPFLRGLRIALDGEEVILAEERSSASADRSDIDLGPVPAIDVNDLADIVSSLMRDVGAMGILLADRTGRVLIAQGATGYVDQEKLAVMVGASFTHSAEMSSLVGGNAWAMHYYDGERLDIFSLALGIHYFMCLIFDGTSRPFGAVNLFGRRAADQIIEMMGEVAYLVKRPEPLPVAAVKPAVPAPEIEEPASARKKKKRTMEVEAVIEAPKPQAAPLEPVGDMDLDALFGQSVDEQVAENLFDLDNLSEIAASLESDEGKKVGYDEAIDMGILEK
jgi:predicted regulator of Ras-like GTPase activity (Roadblock/LC7/MglB family)